MRTIVQCASCLKLYSCDHHVKPGFRYLARPRSGAHHPQVPNCPFCNSARLQSITATDRVSEVINALARSPLTATERKKLVETIYGTAAGEQAMADDTREPAPTLQRLRALLPRDRSESSPTVLW
jgi:hypothetical protein